MPEQQPEQPRDPRTIRLPSSGGVDENLPIKKPSKNTLTNILHPMKPLVDLKGFKKTPTPPNKGFYIAKSGKGFPATNEGYAAMQADDDAYWERQKIKSKI